MDEQDKDVQKDGEDKVVEEVKDFLSDKVSLAVGEMKQEAKAELEAQMKEFVKEQQSAMEKKAGIYHEDVKASREALSQKVKSNIEVALGNKEMTEGMSVGDDEYGGYTVDEELDAEIRALVEEYGVVREKFFVTPLEKGSYKVNKLVSDIAVGWLDEGDAFETDRVEIGQDTLELKKLGVIVALSNELLSDSEADLTRFVTERVAQKFAYHEDRAGLVGDGTDSDGGFDGLLYEVDSENVHELETGDDSYTDITIDDILDARDLLSGSNLNVEIYMNREIKSHLRKSKDGNEAYHFDPQSGLDTIWGMPINEVDVMPDSSDDGEETEFILIGDLEKAGIMGYKGGFVIDEFNTGTVRAVDYDGNTTIDDGDSYEDQYVNLLTSDKRAIRFKERVGFVNVLTDAVAAVKTGSTS